MLLQNPSQFVEWIYNNRVDTSDFRRITLTIAIRTVSDIENYTQKKSYISRTESILGTWVENPSVKDWFRYTTANYDENSRIAIINDVDLTAELEEDEELYKINDFKVISKHSVGIAKTNKYIFILKKD